MFSDLAQTGQVHGPKYQHLFLILKFEFVLNVTYPGYLEFQYAGFTVI